MDTIDSSNNLLTIKKLKHNHDNNNTLMMDDCTPATKQHMIALKASSPRDLDAYDLRQVLLKTNLDFLRQNNSNSCIGNNNNHTDENGEDEDDVISDLRHESLNHILKNSIEMVKNHSIDLKSLNDDDCEVHNNNHLDEDNNNNNNHSIMNDMTRNNNNNNIGKCDVDDQFSHLIDDETNGDHDDVKVSLLKINQ